MSGLPNNQTPRVFTPKRREKPIRVSRGVRYAEPNAASPNAWAAHRFLRVVEGAAPGEAYAEGLDYARSGQTREVRFELGRVIGLVQGRRTRAYSTSISVTPFTIDQWETAMKSMADQAVYAAKLLAGEAPANIEDVFAPLGLRLFPTDAGELVPKCDCSEPKPWCKHACCLGALASQRLGEEPFVMFLLRGMVAADVLDRLRRLRIETGSGRLPGARVSVISAPPPPPLETCLETFWDPSPGLDEIDTTPRPPEVRHALLRRLGPSPFGPGGFPLVGLLATAYDLVGEAVRDGAEATGAPSEVPEEGAADEAGDGEV